MIVNIKKDEKEAGKAAGLKAAGFIREAIKSKGSANIILATGSSQFQVLKQLTSEEDIEWNKVTMFHLDEYIGLPATHNASFRKYLQERFVDKVTALKAVHFINGNAQPQKECDRLEALIQECSIDVALVGIGENGHLAFNDPPADFETVRAFIVVDLDEKCRQQQVNEEWFSSLEDVPTQAISMSVKQIMRSKQLVCTVPGGRKTEAVKCTLEGEVTNLCPASILQEHPDCYLYLDDASASLLKYKEKFLRQV
jgi:glucosamine-6-phosphate deaminase